MILRIEKHEKYVVLDKGFLNDPKISFKAKGVLAYMLSKPDGWNFVETDIARHGKDQSLSVKTAIKELTAAGYITRGSRKRNAKGQLGAYEYIVRENPTTCENQTQDNPTLGNPTLLSNDLSNVMTVVKNKGTTHRSDKNRSDAPSSFSKDVQDFVMKTYPEAYEKAYGCPHPKLTPIQRYRTEQILSDYLGKADEDGISMLEAQAEEFLSTTKTDGNIRAFAVPETLDILLDRIK